MIDFFFRWTTLQFDNRAAAEFERLRKKKIRLGTMDLKIAVRPSQIMHCFFLATFETSSALLNFEWKTG